MAIASGASIMAASVVLLATASASTDTPVITGEFVSYDSASQIAALRPVEPRDEKPTALQQFVIQPETAIRYLGAPASLKDVPLGTMLHVETAAKPDSPTPDSQPAAQVEDDFSRHQRLDKTWRIESVDLPKGTLSLVPGGKILIDPATRIWKAGKPANWNNLQPGQTILVNFTPATDPAEAPLRSAEIWLDAESRAASTDLRRIQRSVLPDVKFFEEGIYVYEKNCRICHGERGDGKGELNDPAAIKPRNFKSGLFKYRSTPWGKLPTTADLIHTIREGRSGTAMGMFSHLSKEELTAVAEYVKYFSSKWRKAENHAAAAEIPQPPKWFSQPATREPHIASGRQLFTQHCAACHGTTAEGNGPAGAALKDQWGEPAKPADLRQPHLRCGDEAIDIVRVLTTGMNGTPMVSFSEQLTSGQKWEIATYVLIQRQNFAETAERLMK